MNDEAAKLFAGHLGVCAVLADVLIDKGIITQNELFERFRQAHAAAGECSAGPTVGHALAEMVEYLEPAAKAGSFGAVKHGPLHGQTILLVEEQAAVAHDIQEALEDAGAEVLVARNAAEALPRIAQFDFSAAVLDWLPDTSEHLTIVRWLKEDGVRLVIHARRSPEDLMEVRGAPVLLKPAPVEAIIEALALLVGADCDERVPVLEPT
jgi:CheY-like chemotaxis protein